METQNPQRRFESKPGVYLIRNLINSKVYVGSAADLSRRWIVHKNDLKNGRHHNRHLQSAFNKYGLAAFDLEVLEIVDLLDGESLRRAEQFWMDKLNVCDARFGYNIVPHSQHKFLSEETRRLLSESRRGKPLSPEHRANISKGNQGKTRSIEHRAKLRAASLRNRGVIVSLEVCVTAVTQKGVRPSVSKLSSEEISRKISDALKGHPVSEETRMKISAANRGRVLTTRRALPRKQREEIRARHANGENFCALGREYGVSRVTIRNVIRNIYGD